MTVVDRDRLAQLVDRERRRYVDTHPRSADLFAEADHLFGRVPMTWMNKWFGGFPIYFDRARGRPLRRWRHQEPSAAFGG
jgi:glutamate-1-semialdehyde 2,1-aminomutase